MYASLPDNGRNVYDPECTRAIYDITIEGMDSGFGNDLSIHSVR